MPALALELMSAPLALMPVPLSVSGLAAVITVPARSSTAPDVTDTVPEPLPSAVALPTLRVPADKVVVLGLVSTKAAVLESPDAIEARIREAAKIVPLERLCLSPQCGFASSEAGNPLSEADQAAKLARVVQVAAKVWG